MGFSGLGFRAFCTFIPISEGLMQRALQTQVACGARPAKCRQKT